MHLSPDQCRALLNLARQAIRQALGTSSLPAHADTTANDPALLQPAGAFVTLHQHLTHRLRGCIGRLDTDQPLKSAVEQMATAVLEDPRFTDDPVSADELPLLDVEITLVFPLRPAPTPLDFDPLNDGILLTLDQRHGCFLPQVARETGWSKEQLLARLCTEKMGLPPTAWQDPQAHLQTFPTLLIGPEPFEGGDEIDDSHKGESDQGPK